MNHKKATKGDKLDIRFEEGGKLTTFTAGGRRRVLVDDGQVYVNGQVKTADGDIYWAVLGIDESSSGEHFDTLVFLPEGGVASGDELVTLKGWKGVFPYRYKYAPILRCRADHHIGEDGWSVL